MTKIKKYLINELATERIIKHIKWDSMVKELLDMYDKGSTDKGVAEDLEEVKRCLIKIADLWPGIKKGFK